MTVLTVKHILTLLQLIEMLPRLRVEEIEL